MTPEQRAWTALRPVLTALRLDPRRVENVVGPGHPDIDYVHGNIELKALESWPLRPSTPVTIETFTGVQAGWLYQRWEANGRAWLMVKVKREWFLFDGFTAMDVWRGMTEGEWRCSAASSSVRFMRTDDWIKDLGLWLRTDLAHMQPHNRARLMRLQAMSSIDKVSHEIGWTIKRLVEVELGLASGTDDLLDFWNS